MKDHIPDWAGGRVSLESRSGIDRLRDIVRDADTIILDQDSTAPITVAQARELLSLVPYYNGLKYKREVSNG